VNGVEMSQGLIHVPSLGLFLMQDYWGKVVIKHDGHTGAAVVSGPSLFQFFFFFSIS